MIDNTSKIMLVKNINIDKDYNNVLSYSENDMLKLCRNNLVEMREDYSFIRSSGGDINVDFSYSNCLISNYIAFQNPDYNNKWFFAWIDDVIYRNDNNVILKYTIDVWSTWFDYWQKKKCFINRQHVNDDTIRITHIRRKFKCR